MVENPKTVENKGLSAIISITATRQKVLKSNDFRTFFCINSSTFDNFAQILSALESAWLQFIVLREYSIFQQKNTIFFVEGWKKSVVYIIITDKLCSETEEGEAASTWTN